MKRRFPVLLAFLICLLTAAGAIAWTNSLMGSLFDYRSPLHETPPSPGKALGEPLARQVVFVLVDALRLDTAMNSEAMPYLNHLVSQGAWAVMHSRPPSYSQPGYSTLLIGAWPDLSDAPALNIDDFEDIPTWTQDNLFSAARRAGLKTAIAGYYWFGKLIPQEDVSASYFTHDDEQTADCRVTDAALPWINSGNYQFVMIHLDQVDYAGHHKGGPDDPRWEAAARQVDDLLREIVAALDLSQDSLLVVSDHGQIDRGGHGGDEPEVLTEPFLLIGAGIKPGNYGDVQMVDVAPTVAALLGTNLPGTSQGRVLVEMLAITPEHSAAIQRAAQTQQERLLQAYQQAIGQQVAPQPGGDPVTAHQGALEAVRQARLRAERLPRAAIALLLLILAVILLYRWLRRDLAWMAIGAALYMLVFNFLYLYPGGRTYSLSVLKSASDLFLFNGSLSLVAMFLGWLVVAWKLKLQGRSPAEAGEAGLGFTLTTIFFLSLPAMWSYVINGALATWTLPDLSSAFLAFMSLFQILLVAVLGLLITGLTALIILLRSRRQPARTVRVQV